MATFGVSKLFVRKCTACGHLMGEHGRDAGAGWREDGTGVERYWTGTGWSEYTRPIPPAEETVPPKQAVQVDVAAIAQLAELHRAGALTDEEFTQAKARLIDRA